VESTIPDNQWTIVVLKIFPLLVSVVPDVLSALKGQSWFFLSPDYAGGHAGTARYLPSEKIRMQFLRMNTKLHRLKRCSQ
jgi:hypothetical protein